MNLGETIYRLRTERNLSQGDLADALDVSRQSVSKWENNSAVPELEKLIKMAEIFGITLDELVTGQQKTAAPPPPPYPSSPAPQRMSAKKIVGIALLVFAGLCLIVFTAVGFLIGAWFWGIVIALPCLLCGLICLLCEHNIGLKCAWAVYLLLWVLLTIVLMR
jgi:DNA-binding XRE family transcriptional regulator